MIRSVMMILGLSLTIGAFGCSSSGGTGGEGGSGGGGEGGSGGSGEGGSGGGGDVVAPACDNVDDLAAIAAGEPNRDLSRECVLPNIPPATSEPDCVTNVTGCLLDGNGGASTPTTLSAECTACTAAQACCITHQCSVLAGGTCSTPPDDAACEQCIAETCTPAYESCGEDNGG